ncbi:MAG: hypothetical protein JWO38_7503 [Gemmataceae bacterium]|nr:hypothetical protein [Gemmataceae bacterium]
MSDRESFLRAIRATPDDDTPRLVFADWLDDRGDPLGEFVRVQIELHAIRDQLDNPRARDLTDRESVLLGTHGHDWLGPAADIANYPAFGPVFRRGLPEMVCLPLDTFLKRGEELFAACPTVREVSLFGLADRGAELAACSYLANVDTLEIADPVYSVFPEGSAALSESLRGARVRCLRTPVLSDPPFCYVHWLHRLAGGIASGWPRWVEFVTYSREDRTTSEQDAAALDRLAGRPVARVVRPFDALFPLAADIGHGFYPGTGDDGEPIILAVRPDGTGMWVFFDRDGRQEDAATFGAIDPAEVESWQTGHGGPIRVREFEIGGLSVRLWPQTYVFDYLQRPFEHPPGVTDPWWQSRGGVLRGWLHEGRFVIEWDGREFWADARGKIISA